VAVGTAVTMLGAGCAVLAGETSQETVLIGVDLELTGVGAELGEVYHNALQLRVEQINEQGLLGDRRLELVVRDNRSDAGTAALNVADLAEDPAVVAIISGGCSACAVASAEVVNDHQVAMIALAPADDVAEPIEDRRWVFKLAPNADHNAAFLAAQLTGAEVATVGLVVGTDAYGADGEEEMTDAADRSEFEIVMSAQINGDEETAQAAASQVMAFIPPVDPAAPPEQPIDEEAPSAGPDALVVWAPAPAASQFAGTVRAAGYRGPLYLDSTAVDDLFLSGAEGTAYEGATLVFNESFVIESVVATSPAKAARKTWFNSYSARYGTYHAFSSFAVDAIALVIETVNRLDTTERDEVRAGLERTQLDGISGPLRITPTNHSGLTSLGLVALVATGDRWQAASG
jgi:branched-chain amino acid transport system substrate-binding protein